MGEPPPYPGTPRWVKVLGLIALASILLAFVLMHTRGRGRHGPGRQAPSSSQPP